MGSQAAGMALALNNIKGISHQGRYEQGERKVTWTGILQLPQSMFLMHLMVFLGLCHLRDPALPSWQILGQQGQVFPDLFQQTVDFQGKAGSLGGTSDLDHPKRYY